MALKSGKEEFVDLDLIDDADDGQARASTREHVVADYAADLKAGDEFPAVMLIKVGVDEYRIADGYHRVRAHKLVGSERILARVAPGTARDALLYGATEANKRNSERLSRADKRRRASIVLTAPEYANLKDAEVGRLIGVSHTAVAKYRRLPLGMPTVDPPSHLVEGKTYWLQYDDGEHGTIVEYTREMPCYLTSHDDVGNEQSIHFPECISARWNAEEFCQVLKRGLGGPRPWRLVKWREVEFACINTDEQYRKWLAYRTRLIARQREDAIEDDEPENETFHSGVSESLADSFSKMRSASAG